MTVPLPLRMPLQPRNQVSLKLPPSIKPMQSIPFLKPMTATPAAPADTLLVWR